MILQFPKRSHGWMTTVTTRTFRIRGHVWTIHDVGTNYHDRGLNDNIVALCSGFYATVARRKSTQGSSFTWSQQHRSPFYFFSQVIHSIPGRISLFRHHSNFLCYQVRLMLPENASDMVDRLSEKAQIGRSKSWRSSPRSWTVLQICSSLVVLIHIFFSPLLDRRHSASKMVSAVANGYEHSVRWRIGLFHINLGKMFICAKIANFKRMIITFISY